MAPALRRSLALLSISLLGLLTLPRAVRGRPPRGRGNQGASAADSEQQTFRGQLQNGDQSLPSGEFFDNHEFNVGPGESLDVELSSRAFRPYLGLVSPSGEVTENAEGRVRVERAQEGRWRAIATTVAPGESGAYTLAVRRSVNQTPGGGASREERGTLAAGDRTLRSGEFADYYEFNGQAGQTVLLDLRSSEFDPYLIFRAPSGEQFENDDHEGSRSQSLLSMNLAESGTWQIIVTTYEPGEKGSYLLSIGEGSAPATPGGVASAPGSRRESGSLAPGDNTLRSGEFIDRYTFEGLPGQDVALTLSSTAFDPYLILWDPAGGQVDNNDTDGWNSFIGRTLDQAGTWTVGVTSNRPGEKGAYELNIQIGGSSAPAPVDRQRDAATLALGQTASGRLEAGDSQNANGKFRDFYLFSGQPGQTIALDMRSAEFDPYLVLTTPSGRTLENDDWEGSRQHARIELTLPEAGRYRVEATSYASGAMGSYSVGLSQGAARPVPQAGGERVYGVFVGISDYQGAASNLAYTADDARRAHQALVEGVGMRPEDGIVLTDAQATRGNLDQALNRIASQITPNDTFVLFFSGHGNRRERRGGFQPTDPDGFDETLVMVDGEIIDDELAESLNRVQAGKQLIVLDACFAGGFQKDLISVPGRMGLFSSEEDVVSMVAAQFMAGGYLAKFFDDAVRGGFADADADRRITALELSHYLGERYRTTVKSVGDIVIDVDANLGYQKLVVDRGSIGPSEPLFIRR